jgi:DNA-directed RNA polymerase subunit RPC12/RpoP
MEEVNVEAECKNCNHAISLHTPRCSKRYHEFAGERICGCERPQYYGAIISDTNLGYTEFHCNKCGKLIGFLNSIDENIYEIIEDEVILCTSCITVNE